MWFPWLAAKKDAADQGAYICRLENDGYQGLQFSLATEGTQFDAAAILMSGLWQHHESTHLMLSIFATPAYR